MIEYTVETESITAPAVPEKAGYTGIWEAYTLDGNVTVNAIYTPITYTVTYADALGAPNANLTEFTVESESITLTDLVMEGYRFDGWFDANGERVTAIEAGSIGDLTLTARWTKLYTVTFLCYDPTTGTLLTVDVQYLEEGENAVAPDASEIVPEGYTFKEWNGSFENVTEDRVITAILEEDGDWSESLN